MTKTWFTSDLHFEHKNIVEYTGRPWAQEDQEEELIRRWNSRVGLMDNVYHLGDFIFVWRKKLDKALDIIKQLNGNIHFIKGNHCDDTLWELIDDTHMAHIAWIKDYAEIKVDGQKIILSHYPIASFNGMHYGNWHCHGHTHGSLDMPGKVLDVGIDNHPDFQVFSFDEVKAHMDSREIYVWDHHSPKDAR